jgi:ammonium transporter, Amt family
MSDLSLDELKVIVANLVEKVRLLESDQIKSSAATSSTQSLKNPAFNSGDIAWMLAATALVFFMTIPGLTLYYAGMAAQKKNLMTIAMQSFSICCLITLVWMIFGYSLSFSEGSPVIGGSSRFFLVNLQTSHGLGMATSIPETLFCTFQLGFAVVAAALMCGSSADRMKFSSMLLFVALWHLLVYCPIAHSNWHSEGFLNKAGNLDWAGGNVVHITAGMSGLVTSLVIGKRRGFGEFKFAPNNILHTITGACFLWVGWLGFNGGSSFAANEQAATAILNTQIAASSAAFSWILTEYFVTRRPTVLGMLNGAIAGLVSITSGAGYVDATGAFFIGLISGPVCYCGISLKKLVGIDDALDAFGLHGIAGVYGGFMTGLFASAYGGKGAFYGGPVQIGLQVYGIVVCSGWSLFMTAILLVLVDVTIGLRVSADAEKTGLDRSSHGEGLYAERSRTITPSERVAELLKSYASAKAKSSEAAAAQVQEGGRAEPRRYLRDGPVSEDSSLTNSEAGDERPPEHPVGEPDYTPPPSLPKGILYNTLSRPLGTSYPRFSPNKVYSQEKEQDDSDCFGVCIDPDCEPEPEIYKNRLVSFVVN